MIALNSRNFFAAECLFKTFLQMRPDHFGALNLLTVVLIVMNRFREAEQYISRAVDIDDKSDASFYNYGIVLKALGRRQEALAQFARALSLNAKHVKALNNRGAVFNDLGQYEQALSEFDKAISVDPSYFDAHYNKGNALSELKNYEQACAAYARALAVKPDSAECHNNRGRALEGLERPDEALACYNQAIALKPVYAEAYFNRGNALAELKRLDEAIASYDKAVAVKSDYAEAYNNRGNAFKNLQRLDEAIASYDKAVALKSDYAEAYNNRGNAFKDLKRLDEAIASYDKAVAVKPDFAEAYGNRGNALRELKRLDEAIASYDKAISLNPALEFLIGEALHTRMQTCDWRRYENDIAEISARIESDDKAVSPFIALTSFDSCATQLRAAKIWVSAKYSRTIPLPFVDKYARREKIRIGYYSSDFRMQPLSFLMIDVFRLHDKSLFETYAYSFDNPRGDVVNAQLRDYFGHFIDVSKLSDRQVASLSREHEIDIAVDLVGFTGGRRTDILARRPAPIQVNFLGFPGAMGADFIDYIIADPIVIGHRQKRFFTEKVVSLPDTYYPTSYNNDLYRTDKVFRRAEVGLPDDAFVFCCFNNNYKIVPDVFEIWMRIMHAVDGSVLWLFQDNATAAANLRKEAIARGVDGQRLIFASRMPVAEHLARIGVADLFLDTLPYNAHTTATDALWAGLPILTKPGEAFAGRVAASVLTAVGVPELITESYVQYEALAIELASNADKLAAIKRKINNNRLTAPLFDTARYTKYLEKAYGTMYERHHAGRAPDDIIVDR